MLIQGRIKYALKGEVFTWEFKRDLGKNILISDLWTS